MKFLTALMLFGLCCLLGGSEWVGSYREAQQRALRENKKILIFFSGSDWCEPGRVLERDLFRTEAFQRLASEKYVLYNADFPKYTKLGYGLEERNRRLASRYGISRFPAVVVVEPKYGSLLVKQVGMSGGMTPKKLLEKLSKIEKATARSGQVRKPGPAPAGKASE